MLKGVDEDLGIVLVTEVTISADPLDLGDDPSKKAGGSQQTRKA